MAGGESFSVISGSSPDTQEGESGASLRAVNWRVVAELPERKGWSVPSRPREDPGTDGVVRMLWEAS